MRGSWLQLPASNFEPTRGEACACSRDSFIARRELATLSTVGMHGQHMRDSSHGNDPSHAYTNASIIDGYALRTSLLVCARGAQNGTQYYDLHLFIATAVTVMASSYSVRLPRSVCC